MRTIILTLTVCLLMNPSSFAEENVKQPNVSGQFYEANPSRLRKIIRQYLSEADVSPSNQRVEVILVPHAGYVYSGWVAAYSFKAVSKTDYTSVIIIGPSHYYPFDKISVWHKGGYQTPLGVAPVDEELAAQITSASPDFYFEPKVFDREHSVEVEIPFVQEVFPKAKIVPIIMGRTSQEMLINFVKTLGQVVGKREDVLIVISTDLSHYHDDQKARELDYAGIESIQTLDVNRLVKGQSSAKHEIDAVFPVMATMLYAQAKGLTDVQLLKYANSGDVTQDKSRVVGYAAMTFGAPSPTSGERAASLSLTQRKRLIDIARQTIEHYVKTGKVLKVKESDQRLMASEGAFVTINKKGRLRGCMGQIVTGEPLYQTIRDVSITSSTQDPRFAPVAENELGDIEIEISVLSRPHRIHDVNEIRLGEHGVIISKGPRHRGVFLPQVATDTGWSKEEFLSQLSSQKAGLPPDAWKDPDTIIEIFSAEVFEEHDVQ